MVELVLPAAGLAGARALRWQIIVFASSLVYPIFRFGGVASMERELSYRWIAIAEVAEAITFQAVTVHCYWRSMGSGCGASCTVGGWATTYLVGGISGTAGLGLLGNASANTRRPLTVTALVHLIARVSFPHTVCPGCRIDRASCGTPLPPT